MIDQKYYRPWHYHDVDFARVLEVNGRIVKFVVSYSNGDTGTHHWEMAHFLEEWNLCTPLLEALL
jgi:hypothetical protein